LGRKRGRKPEEWKLKKNFSEENEAGEKRRFKPPDSAHFYNAAGNYVKERW
jgi:hypothetical protein